MRRDPVSVAIDRRIVERDYQIECIDTLCREIGLGRRKLLVEMMCNGSTMEDGMKQAACRYAVVQFVPYLETGEFANVGVAMVCPQTGYFGLKLQSTRKSKRITNFREPCSHGLCRGIRKELERIEELVARQMATGRPEMVREVVSSTTTAMRQ